MTHKSQSPLKTNTRRRRRHFDTYTTNYVLDVDWTRSKKIKTIHITDKLIIKTTQDNKMTHAQVKLILLQIL